MSKRILMVEDFPVIQKFYEDAIKKAGYEFDIAGDGEQALAKVADNDYDIILLDLLLPGINGIEFLEKYHGRPEKTKVVVLSDFTETSRVDRARELGVVDYLVKSDYPPSELVAKLDEVTGEKPTED